MGVRAAQKWHCCLVNILNVMWNVEIRHKWRGRILKHCFSLFSSNLLLLFNFLAQYSSFVLCIYLSGCVSMRGILDRDKMSRSHEFKWHSHYSVFSVLCEEEPTERVNNTVSSVPPRKSLALHTKASYLFITCTVALYSLDKVIWKNFEKKTKQCIGSFN